MDYLCQCYIINDTALYDFPPTKIRKLDNIKKNFFSNTNGIIRRNSLIKTIYLNSAEMYYFII